MAYLGLQGQKQSAAGAAQRRLLRSGLAAFEQALADSREQRATTFCSQHYTSRCADVTGFQCFKPVHFTSQNIILTPSFSPLCRHS